MADRRRDDEDDPRIAAAEDARDHTAPDAWQLGQDRFERALWGEL